MDDVYIPDLKFDRFDIPEPAFDPGMYDNMNYNVDGGGGFEQERLRAALHGSTPGAGGTYKDAMFQLGLTPISDDGRRRGRISGRPESRGRLSERSSDPGSRGKLSDMLEELKSAEGLGGDMASFLPVVEEEEEREWQGPGQGGHLHESDFSLLEGSGPTMPTSDAARPDAAEHAQTLHVLASLRQLAGNTTVLSLDEATTGLSRLDAARTFAHVLGMFVSQH